MHSLKIITFIVLSLMASACSRNEFEKNLQDHSLDITFNNFFNLKSISKDPLIIVGENVSQNQIVKFNVKLLSEKDSKQEVKKVLMRLIAQFQFSIAPYPGQLTAAINCGSKYHPQIKQQSSLWSIVSFTNDRLAVSVCDKDSYTYQRTTSFFIDEKRERLIIVDLYQTKESDPSTSQKMLSKYFKNLENVNLLEFELLFKKI